ncbi:MAG: peptidoglycan-binding protein [Acidimicrobiia bacterium]
MSGPEPVKLTADDLMQEGATALPAKEVLSLLDLNVDLDLGLDLAAPIDLAVAANANVAAPIDAAVAANLLSVDSTAGALADQDVLIDQGISGEAIAEAPQTSVLDQSGDTVGDGDSGGDTGSDTGTGDVTTDPSSLLSGGPLLDVDVNVALDADIASPIAGAVAANANVAAPIDAAAAANVLSVGSEATAVADQDAIIVQDLEDVVADATAEQDSTITQ